MKNKNIKTLFAFVPATLVGLFLLNSFVLKDGDADKVIKNKLGYVNIAFSSLQGLRHGTLRYTILTSASGSNHLLIWWNW